MRLYNQDLCTPVGTSSTWRVRTPPNSYVPTVKMNPETKTQKITSQLPASASAGYRISPASNMTRQNSSNSHQPEDPIQKRHNLAPSSPPQNESSPMSRSTLLYARGAHEKHSDTEGTSSVSSGRYSQNKSLDHSRSPSSNHSRSSVGPRDPPISDESPRIVGRFESPKATSSGVPYLHTPRPSFSIEEWRSPTHLFPSPPPSKHVALHSQASTPTTVSAEELHRDMACYLFPSGEFRFDIDQPISGSNHIDDGMSSSTISTHSTFLKTLQCSTNAAASVPCGIRAPFPAPATRHIQESQCPPPSRQDMEESPFVVIKSTSGRMIGITPKTGTPFRPKTSHHGCKKAPGDGNLNLQSMRLKKKEASTQFFDLPSPLHIPSDFEDGLSTFSYQATKVSPLRCNTSPLRRKLHPYPQKTKQATAGVSKFDPKSYPSGRNRSTNLQSVGSLNIRMQELNPVFSPTSFDNGVRKTSNVSTKNKKDRKGAMPNPIVAPRFLFGSSRKQNRLGTPSLQSMGSLNFQMQELSHEIPPRFGPGAWGENEFARDCKPQGTDHGPSQRSPPYDTSSTKTIRSSEASTMTVFEENTSFETPTAPTNKHDKVNKKQKVMSRMSPPDFRRYSAMFAAGFSANNVKDAMVYDSVDPTLVDLIAHASQGEGCP